MDEDFNGIFDYDTIRNGSSLIPEEYADLFVKVKNGTSIQTGRIATFILMIASVFGCIGNVLICYVIIYNKNMHTSINMYLFSLAVSDFLQLITFFLGAIYSIKLSRLTRFSGLRVIFVIVKSLYGTSNIASILITLSVTIDRYIAVCYPFRDVQVSRRSRTLKNIVIIWMLSSVYVTLYEILPIICINNSRFYCKALNILQSLEINVILFFLIPMALNMILYTFIGFCIWRSSHFRWSSSNRNQNKTGKIVFCRQFKISVAVVIECLVCLSPMHIVSIINKNHLLDHVTTVRENLIIVSFILYLSSTFIDPIIYSIMSTKFRMAFKNLLSTSGLRCCKTRSVETLQSALEITTV